MANNVPALRDRWMAEEEEIGPAACSCDTSTRKMAEIIQIFFAPIDCYHDFPIRNIRVEFIIEILVLSSISFRFKGMKM
jgi:hypothetical protein